MAFPADARPGRSQRERGERRKEGNVKVYTRFLPDRMERFAEMVDAFSSYIENEM